MSQGVTERPKLAGDVQPRTPPVRQGVRLWRAVRHDIGRKLTAIALAFSLWYLLQTYVTGKDERVLDVIPVTSRAEADLQRSYTSAIYLVVPEDLLVRDTSARRVTLSVKGLRTDIENLEMSAIIEIDPGELGDQDEIVLEKPLERAAFRSRGSEPDLAEFKVRPPKLDISLARRTIDEITLGPDNVSIRGAPKDGYDYDKSKAIVRPNRVFLSGPRTDIEWLLAEPSRLRLSPVDVQGRVFEVSQQVGLDPEKVDRNVQLRTSGGVVEVSIPIQPQPTSRELLAIPVHYENEGTLKLGRPPKRVASCTPTLDIRVTGPRAILDGLTRDELGRRIRIEFDWADAQLPIGTAKVRIYFAADLPKGELKISGLNGRDPEIEYRLEDVPVDTAVPTSGESP